MFEGESRNASIYFRYVYMGLVVVIIWRINHKN